MTSLYGLLLAGGLSSRMKQDKAALKYGAESQLERAFALLKRHSASTFVSVRAAQVHDPLRAAYPLIVDSVEGEGPVVGIRSALAAHPDVAWLVLACDLPFLTDISLAHLVAQRDPHVLATAYLSAHDGLPEPLCAIWEPAAGAALAAYQAHGGRCPRKFLMRQSARLLAPLDSRATENVNTPEEYTRATAALEPTPMQLTIHYYALMREQAGRSEETVQTTATTPSELYAELSSRHPFTLDKEQLKVAINSEFCDWSRPLAGGDAVVFIPPVAGG